MVGRSQTSTDTMSVVTPEMQQLELVRQLWLPTRNASGLGFDPVANHGNAWFGVFHSSGDYHKAQEGSRMNGLNSGKTGIISTKTVPSQETAGLATFIMWINWEPWCGTSG